MSTPLDLLKVKPVGNVISAGFVEEVKWRGLRAIQNSVYPPSPNGSRLSELRRRQNCSIRDAARLLGIRCSELSGLEYGRFTLSDTQWAYVFELLGGSK